MNPDTPGLPPRKKLRHFYANLKIGFLVQFRASRASRDGASTGLPRLVVVAPR